MVGEPVASALRLVHRCAGRVNATQEQHEVLDLQGKECFPSPKLRPCNHICAVEQLVEGARVHVIDSSDGRPVHWELESLTVLPVGGAKKQPVPGEST
ncbi:hypothetical protein NDU88_000666 [Pleurodeles waltl]|uniref:DUF5641 domain-containing protein n=1 Tax=Pleurodeles waltl TaxID=8319 RepID=A0AAV7M338_PLEWA|nr:hypothetical protein NDU88_000666 [Pleurodeles waltl]